MPIISLEIKREIVAATNVKFSRYGIERTEHEV